MEPGRQPTLCCECGVRPHHLILHSCCVHGSICSNMLLVRQCACFNGCTHAERSTTPTDTHSPKTTRGSSAACCNSSWQLHRWQQPSNKTDSANKQLHGMLCLGFAAALLLVRAASTWWETNTGCSPISVPASPSGRDGDLFWLY